MFCSVCLAQDSPDQFVGAGASYNAYASPNVSINGLHAKKIKGISENTYSFTFLDLISSTEKPFTVTPVITPGIAQELFKLGELPIYGTTGLGVAIGQDQDKLTTGSTVGWAWTAGFASSIAISKDHSWKILPHVRVIKSNLTDWQLIFGGIIGWGK
jgi:hypothetical protein